MILTVSCDEGSDFRHDRAALVSPPTESRAPIEHVIEALGVRGEG